jgi:hypothetical protein
MKLLYRESKRDRIRQRLYKNEDDNPTARRARMAL